MAHVYVIFFKDKLIKNSPSLIQGDRDALGHPQKPRQTQPASTTYAHQKFTWRMFIYYFSTIYRFKWSQVDHENS